MTKIEGADNKPCTIKALGIQNNHENTKAMKKNNHKFRFSDLFCFITIFLLYICTFLIIKIDDIA
ncbi:MAG: hypothetical protein STSR0004_12960 [Peptococcaceae bacterium]